MCEQTQQEKQKLGKLGHGLVRVNKMLVIDCNLSFLEEE